MSDDQTNNSTTETPAPVRRGRKRGATKVNRAPQDPARRRVLLLCEQTGEAGPVRIIKAFANRYRLRKWVAVAADIDPTLKARIKVFHGRPADINELLGDE